MAYQHLEPVSKQLTIVVGLSVVGLMAFGLCLSYYRNILFEQTLHRIRMQNNELKMAIDEGYRDLEYFRSSQYRDKYAKENLGLVNAGENMLIIQENTGGSLEDIDPHALEERREAAFYELLKQMPIIEHWRLYLFEKKRASELKERLL